MITSAFRSLIRLSAFIEKELKEVLRQTRLIMLLVFGPFLIMLLFGLGYRSTGREMRTVFVVSPENPLRARVIEYAESMDWLLVYQGITDDETEALNALLRNQVDMVLVIPDDASHMIEQGEQVVVRQYHNEIDPFQVDYVKYLGNAAVGEVNRKLLVSTAEQGQQRTPLIRQNLESARVAAAAMRKALMVGDAVAAKQEKVNLDSELDALTLAFGASAVMIDDELKSPSELNTINTRLENINRDRQELSVAGANNPSNEDEIERLQNIEEELSGLENELSKFESANAFNLVNPFVVETASVEGIELQPAGFFTPGVIILLLQHLAVTFAALSIVREQRSGTMELFRVSPLGPIETLLGKYISYLLLGSLISAVITGTVIFMLGVPMLGHWSDYALVVLAMLFTALGMGFVVSLISKTITQAVQYSMLILLGSLFFSGFLLNLNYLSGPVRVVSNFLPATYGILLLQDIILRGRAIALPLLLSLLGFGIGSLLIAWALLRRRMRTG
jgi:ABC-2 type transport system permease protein